jgi:Flp pilus assembly protein TadD
LRTDTFVEDRKGGKAMRNHSFKMLTVLLLFVSSCSSTCKLYKGARLSRDRVSLLVVPNERRNLILVSIDGRKNGSWIAEYELLPGAHVASVRFCKTIVTPSYYVTFIRRWSGEGEAKAGFEAKPGHRYSLYAEVCRSGEQKMYRSDTLDDSWFEKFPSTGTWRPIVHDLDTGEVVSQGALYGAQRLLELGRYDDAIKAFELATELSPKDSDAWYQRGLALGKLKRNQEALKCFEKAVKLDPGNQKFWYDRGACLVNLTRNEEALKCFNRCLSLDATYQQALYGKGTALINMGRYGEAVRILGQLLALNPAHDDAWFRKAVAHGRMGQREEAQRCLDRSLQINPRNEAALEARRRLVLKRGSPGKLSRPAEKKTD